MYSRSTLDLVTVSKKCRNVVLQIQKAEGIDWLTCAGLESIASDLRKSGKDATETALRDICKELTNKVDDGIKVTVAPMIFWRSFEESYRKTCNDIWRSLQNDFRRIEFLPRISNLRLSDDGVHLQERSATKYIEHIVEESLATWLREGESEAESDDTTGSQASEKDADKTIVGMSTPALTNRKRSFKEASESAGISALRAEFKSFKSGIESRQAKDLLFFAKHEEQLDVARNERNLDKVVFQGVYIEKLEGKPAEKIPILKAAIKRVLKALLGQQTAENGDVEMEREEEDTVPKMMFVAHVNPQVRSPYRVVEVRFENKETALMIRETFGRKRKEWRTTGMISDALNGVSVNLSLTRETRIRIEVMKALAKVLTSNTTGNLAAYVLQFSTRPMLKVTIKQDPDTEYSRVYGYTEAIDFVKNSGYVVSDQDLFQAYQKAGNMKNLEHRFAILKDNLFTPPNPPQQRQKLSNEADRRHKKSRK